MSSFALSFISMAIPAVAISYLVSSFADPSVKTETIIAVVSIYFVMGFFGYMRSYAKSEQERTRV